MREASLKAFWSLSRFPPFKASSAFLLLYSTDISECCRDRFCISSLIRAVSLSHSSKAASLFLLSEAMPSSSRSSFFISSSCRGAGSRLTSSLYLLLASASSSDACNLWAFEFFSCSLIIRHLFSVFLYSCSACCSPSRASLNRPSKSAFPAESGLVAGLGWCVEPHTGQARFSSRLSARINAVFCRCCPSMSSTVCLHSVSCWERVFISTCLSSSSCCCRLIMRLKFSCFSVNSSIPAA